MDTLSVRPRSTPNVGGTRHIPAYPGQISLFDQQGGIPPMELHDGGVVQYGCSGQTGNASGVQDTSSSFTNPASSAVQPSAGSTSQPSSGTSAPTAGTTQTTTDNTPQPEPSYEKEAFIDPLDREGVVKAINDSGLLSYDVRNVRINNYLNSL